jgi:serine/threonine protein kinase
VQLLLALHHCHHSFLGEWSLLHRDIKPENGELNGMNQVSASMLPSSTVLFSENGTVKLGDFGLSKILEASQQQAISFVGVRIGRVTVMYPFIGLLINVLLADSRLSCPRKSASGEERGSSTGLL